MTLDGFLPATKMNQNLQKQALLAAASSAGSNMHLHIMYKWVKLMVFSHFLVKYQIRNFTLFYDPPLNMAILNILSISENL